MDSVNNPKIPNKPRFNISSLKLKNFKIKNP